MANKVQKNKLSGEVMLSNEKGPMSPYKYRIMYLKLRRAFLAYLRNDAQIAVKKYKIAKKRFNKE